VIQNSFAGRRTIKSMAKLHKHEPGSSEMVELAASYVLGCLSETERAEFESHLREGCEICNAEISRVGVDVAALARSSAPAVPPGMRERFLIRMQKEADTSSLVHEVLPNSSGMFIARTEAMNWQAGAAPGIWAKVLFADQQRQSITSLVRMEPGARYAPHRHHGPEEVFLLSGDLMIEGQQMKSGDYCRAETGSIHGDSYTQAGCLFILTASQLDEVLPGRTRQPE
jgi:anti-sigma factor ChrR (cupin superfamily)